MTRDDPTPTCSTGHLILIAGGSAAGKSQLARDIATRFQHVDVAVFSHDAYYRDVSNLSAEELRSYNFDHPNALDFPLLRAHVAALLGGSCIQLPEYDFVSHQRRASPQALGPVDIVILEGILALHDDELVTRADLRLFVDTEADIRLVRRLRRDTTSRGIPAEQVLEQYMRFVKPMHDAFVEPSRKRADMIIPGDRPADRALKMLDGYVLRTLVDEAILERASRRGEPDRS